MMATGENLERWLLAGGGVVGMVGHEGSWYCPRCRAGSDQARWGPSGPEGWFTITCPECGVSLEVHEDGTMGDDGLVDVLRIRKFTLPPGAEPKKGKA